MLQNDDLLLSCNQLIWTFACIWNEIFLSLNTEQTFHIKQLLASKASSFLHFMIQWQQNVTKWWFIVELYSINSNICIYLKWNFSYYARNASNLESFWKSIELSFALYWIYVLLEKKWKRVKLIKLFLALTGALEALIWDLCLSVCVYFMHSNFAKASK